MKSIVLLPVLLVAGCATGAHHPDAITAKRVLVCHGRSHTTSTYPPPPEDGNVAFRILMDANPGASSPNIQIPAMFAIGDGKAEQPAAKPTPICGSPTSQFDRCKATWDGSTIVVTAMQQMTFTRLTVNLKTGAFGYGRGGLDGGVEFEGTCR